MRAGIDIRELNEEDIPQFYKLLYELANYEGLTSECTCSEKSIHQLFFGDDAVMYGLLAWEGDEAIGMATYYYNASTFLGKRGVFIEDIFILPGWRCRGIGKHLFLEIKKHARVNECGRLEWRALDWNKTALDFYEAQGASIEQQWLLIRLSL